MKVLNVVRVYKDAQSAISQGYAAKRGQIGGKLAEAGYNYAIRASNNLWELYSETSHRLDDAIRELGKASLPKAEK